MTPQKTGGEGGRRGLQDPSMLPQRELGELLERQRCGDLRVRAAAAFRALVAERGLAEAYEATDVVVAAEATFTDQASLVLNLGPTDPPIRLREPQIAGVAALAGGVSGDLVLPIGGAMAPAPAGLRCWPPCWPAAAWT